MRDQRWRREVGDLLSSDPRFSFLRKGDRLSQGICPQCGQKELWGSIEKPYKLFCNRREKCGHTVDVKTLYPQVFQRLRYLCPPTQSHPFATADAYLNSRGLDVDRWRGLYSQSKRKDGQGVLWPTVAFTLTNGTTWHRLIDYPGADKSRAEGYKGSVWMPPDQPVFGKLYLTEGIFDAMSLIQSGIAAISILSASHIPDQFLEEHRLAPCEWILALDHDRAGIESSRKLAKWTRERAMNVSVIFPPYGKDWNEHLLCGNLDSGRLEKTLKEAAYLGNIENAVSPAEYFALYYEKHRRPTIFEFESRTYYGKPDEKDRPVTEFLGSFALKILYSKRSQISHDKSRYTHVFAVTTPEKKYKITLSSQELTKNQEFKNALMDQCGEIWSGNSARLDALARRQMKKSRDTVRRIETIGYDKGSDCYLFNDRAYDPNGHVYFPNRAGYFKIGDQCLELRNREAYYTPEEPHDLSWFFALVKAYPGKGLAALGFFVASLFAEQWYQKTGFFPFLSLFGDPNTGKSSLINILNKLLSRDIAEGMNSSKGNTRKGELRKLGKLSNLPLAIIEANEFDKIRFDFNLILSLYNRNPLQLKAAFTNDMTEKETAFLATLLFAQNIEQFQNKQQRQRVISLPFRSEEQNQDTLRAQKELSSLSGERLGGFRHLVLSRRRAILKRQLEVYDSYVKQFHEAGVQVTRVADNHAVPASAADAVLDSLFPEIAGEYRAENLAYLIRAALRKERHIEEESDLVSYFFELLREMIEGGLKNHSKREDQWAIRFPDVDLILSEKKIHFSKQILFEELRRSRRFIAYKQFRSALDGQSKKCWIFQR